MNREQAIRLLDPKTAVKALTEIEYYGGFSGYDACIKAIEDACMLAIEDMQKQIPKKPNEYENKYYACPTCGNITLMKWEQYPDIPMDTINGLPYCLGCGQALNWEDDDDSES